MTVPDPILIDVPTRLACARLQLRCPQPGDGAAVHAAVLASLSDLRAWPAALPWARQAPSVTVSERWCRLAQAEFILRQQLSWLILSADGATVLGACGLHQPDWDHGTASLGYWVHRAHQRRGYASEAVGRVCELAFDTLGMQRLSICCDVQNLASARVAERAGFIHEARLRHSHRDPGGLAHDTLLYARIAP
ncbi:GNAT family N-acetyltransferase [Chitiniphilus purpureus]|uniref:GNAT family N-acetyltransferase n=1 Tax=Chitiniphilus purpureus TaxID=2981137 RepID=A0ABY6DIV2_9NEIS|nr:GNAT family N-acetyltransferase [Chitiniphilus sp. CD1]UXY14275.1 GNAT family N-acetyltransferase [Chitiniphilus sp. CD1]